MIDNTLKHVQTRFRAYSLGTEGASYSFWVGNHFTLIEARATDKSIPSIVAELRACMKTYIDCLHITSWDMDHCKLDELLYILETWKPRLIEYPGYSPETDNAKDCLDLIVRYKTWQAERDTMVTCRSMDPVYIKGLVTAEKLGYRDVVYHPRALYPESNNNSTVQMFRKGSFNVGSLGDVEHVNIGSYLRGCTIFNSELDVLIAPHHGAENPILTPKFMKAVEPTLAVCSNDYDDKFGHPDESVRALFEEYGVPLLCTKTGDVLVESQPPHATRFYAFNVHGAQVHPKGPFISKKSALMQQNLDSLRNRYAPSSRPFIRR